MIIRLTETLTGIIFLCTDISFCTSVFYDIICTLEHPVWFTKELKLLLALKNLPSLKYYYGFIKRFVVSKMLWWIVKHS